MKTLAHFPHSCYPIIILLEERKKGTEMYMIKYEETGEFYPHAFENLDSVQKFIENNIVIDEETLFTVYKIIEVGEFCSKVTIDFFPCEEKE